MDWKMTIDLWHIVATIGIGVVVRVITTKVGAVIDVGREMVSQLHRIDQGMRELTGNQICRYDRRQPLLGAAEQEKGG